MTYRPDIDGLRAVAIIPVVLFHFGFQAIPGGFVGVDVFFVISGFLITSVLLNDIRQGRFSIVHFYERRIRRILPALFFMLAVISGVAMLVLLPDELMDFGKMLSSTTAFVSNIFFWQASGYFDRAAEAKPLLHTWSLAVEEQFYIFFPLLLWAASKWFRRHLALVLALLFAGSLGVSIWAMQAAPSAAFYLLPSRAFELLIGAILAIGVIPAIENSLMRRVLSGLGLLLIVGSVVMITPAMAFPGWIALVPCIGAALIIYAGSSVLQAKPFVLIGLISYPLYLWHWPLWVLTKQYLGRDPGSLEVAGLLAASVALATFSCRYVEAPFRNQSVSRRVLFGGAAGASFAAFALAAVFTFTGGLPGRLPEEARQYANDAERRPNNPECFNLTAHDVQAGRLCAIGAQGVAPSFVVWGDSHADRMAAPIGQIAAANGRSGLVATTGSCPPLVGASWPSAGCQAFNDAVVRAIDALPVEYVIVTAMWANYAEGQRLGVSSFNPLTDARSGPTSVEENHRAFVRSLQRTVDHFTQQGKRVVIIGSVPETEQPVPEALARATWHGGQRDIGPDRSEFDERQETVRAALKVIAPNPRVRIIEPSAALCASACIVERAGKALYVDDNHLSAAGLRLVKPLLADAFSH